ncbi:MAG TPA: HK97-gp10 family putative phage morphogenesis protein [Propylenella sp.]
MVAKFEVKLEGAKELDEVLQKLPRGAQRLALVGALRAAAKPILAAARSKVAVRTGGLKKSLGVRVLRSRVHQAAVAIGPRPGRGGDHGILVEYGTVPRTRVSGGSTGAMPPQPFLRPALDSNRERAAKIIVEELGDRIAREAEKLTRRFKSKGGR